MQCGIEETVEEDARKGGSDLSETPQSRIAFLADARTPSSKISIQAAEIHVKDKQMCMLRRRSRNTC